MFDSQSLPFNAALLRSSVIQADGAVVTPALIHANYCIIMHSNAQRTCQNPPINLDQFIPELVHLSYGLSMQQSRPPLTAPCSRLFSSHSAMRLVHLKVAGITVQLPTCQVRCMGIVHPPPSSDQARGLLFLAQSKSCCTRALPKMHAPKMMQTCKSAKVLPHMSKPE